MPQQNKIVTRPKGPAPAPFVSVVMPVRDAADTVDDAFRSILAQSRPDLEVVAVLDHSSDDTPERVSGWASRDPRVRPVPVEGEGLIDALNTGVRHARGPVVARMDADDLMHPRRLELQTAMLAVRPDVGIVSCLVESFPRREVREGYRIYERWLNALVSPSDIARERFIESPIPHPTACLSKALLVDCGAYVDDGRPEDYDLWLRLLGRGVRAAKVREVLHYWRDSETRHSRVHPRYSVENFLRTKARHLARGPLTDTPCVVWGAGRMGRRLSRHLIREGVRITAFIDIDPKKIGRTLRGRPILSPDGLPPAGPAAALAAVGSREARGLIRRRVTAAFYREGADFYCVA